MNGILTSFRSMSTTWSWLASTLSLDVQLTSPWDSWNITGPLPIPHRYYWNYFVIDILWSLTIVYKRCTEKVAFIATRIKHTYTFGNFCFMESLSLKLNFTTAHALRIGARNTRCTCNYLNLVLIASFSIAIYLSLD